MMTDLNKLVKVALVALTMMVGAQSACADEVTVASVVENTKTPFGFATRNSRTDASSTYNITGGGAYTVDDIKTMMTTGGITTGGSATVDGKKIIVLRSDGTSDMGATILSAITNNDIIVFDGSGTSTDFLVNEQIALRSLSNKTLIGLNGARLCTAWHLTDVIKSWLNAVETSSGSGVSNASTASGTGGSFWLKNIAGEDSLQITIDEEGEYLTRKTLAEKGQALFEAWRDGGYVGEEPENSYFLRTERYKKSGIFYIEGCENLIIRNICFVGPGSVDVGGVDLISVINGTNHVWADHCDFIDGQDGNFDITNASDFITVSWCHFRYTDHSYVHQNTNLVGSGDSKAAAATAYLPAGEDYGKLNVTFANNEWGENCRSRMPMGRAGKIHMLNNWYNCPGNTENCINPRLNSEYLIEGNYFAEGVTKTYKMNSAVGVSVSDNTYADVAVSTKATASGSAVTVPYSYTTISSLKVPDMVELLVGPVLDIKPTYTVNPDNSEDPENPLYTLEATTTRAANGLTFSVWADHTMSYQWYKATEADLSDAAAIDGATRNSYTYKSSDEGTVYFYCVASGLAGDVASNTIKVTISGTGEPIFVTNLKSYLASAYEAPKGVSYTLAVDAGDAPSYQWYHNTTPSTEGATAIEGATNKSYTYTTPTGSAADVRDYFYCIASNTVDGKEFNVQSNIACVKYVAMQTLINFVATTVEPGNPGGGNLSGITEEGVTHNATKTCNGQNLYPLIFGSNYDKGVYAVLKPEGGFQIGDKLTVAGYINNSNTAKYSQIRIYTHDYVNGGVYTTLALTENVINSNAAGTPNVDPVDYEYTFEAAVDSVCIGRQGDTGMNVSKVVVTRGDPDEPNMPYITTDIDETYETTAGTAVDITMVAEDADSYAWYTVSGTDSYETGKAVIEGEDGATCSFTQATAGTYYVYGVAISGTGEVHKRDTTRIATVTVVAGAPVTTENLINFVADTNEPDATDLEGITLSASGAVVATGNNGYKTNSQALKALQLTATDGYIELTVTGGFKKDDVITVAGYYSNKDSKTTGAKLTKSDGTTVLFTTDNFINGRTTNDDATSGTYTLTEDINDVLRIYRTGGTSTNIYQITVTREVAAPVYVEKAIYTTDFQDWTDASASTSEPYPTHAARTTSKEDFTFTLFNTQVDNDNAEMSVSPAPSAGALKAAKNAGTAANTAYIKVSSLSNITKIMYVHGATGGSRGWGLKVKGTQENGTVDDDWVTVSSAYAYASSGQKSKSGDTIRVDINRTDCELQFYNLSGNNYAYLNDLKIYGMVEQTSCDEPTAVKGAWQEATEKWRYTVSTTSDDAYLHYTIDDGAEQTYEGASTTIDLSPGAKLVVWAVDPTGSVESSAEVSVTSAAMPKATKPTITVGALSMASEIYPVTITAGAGETIHYTTDGTTPTEASAIYSSAIDVAPSTTIKAVSVKTHYANSDIVSAATLAFSHPEGDEAIVMDNGASGENKGISYTVASEYNAGTYSGNSGTGIKYQTGKAVGPTGTNTGFRIYVNDGFIIKKLVFTNFSSNNENTETFNHVYVDASTTDIRDVNDEEYTDIVPPFYNASAGDKSMTWTLDNLNARDSVIFHVTKGYGQIRALVQVYYEIDDSPVSLSINGGDAIAVNETNFPENIYTNSTVYDEVPTLKLTTSKGFVYDFAYTGTDVDTKKSKYAYTLRGTTYEVWVRVKAVAAPLISIADEMTLVKPDADHITSGAGINGGYKVTLSDIKDGATPYIIIDSDIESTSARDYKAVAVAYDADKEYYALKSVRTFCSYEDEDTHNIDSTSVRYMACPENTYSKTKPFAVFLYQTGYGDTGVGQEDGENAASYDPTLDQIHLGLADQYNVIDFTFASGQSDKSITELMPSITNAKLVVLSEMIGGSGQWIDAEGNNTGSTHLAMSFRDDLIGVTNVLNMKMFFYSQSKNNTSRWAWAQPTTLSSATVNIMPTNAMYKVFENVSFSRDGSIKLFDGIDEEGTLNHLQLVHNYNEDNEALPNFTSLATATDVDGEEYDALHYFERGGYTYVGTGISINDYKKYDDNLRQLVSTIGSMINSGESLGTLLDGLPAPRIKDNGDGSATITNNNVSAVTYYKTSASADETWDAATIKAANVTTTDFLTEKFPSDVYVYAISDVSGTMSEVAVAKVKGSTKRFFHRQNADAEAEGTETSVSYEYNAASITVPYNQTFRKKGYSVTQWKVKDSSPAVYYYPGQTITDAGTIAQDIYLEAVWTANTKKVTDTNADQTAAQRTVTWNFLQSDGAPALSLEYGSTKVAQQGFIVGQMVFSNTPGDHIDVAMDIDADNTSTLPGESDVYNGKFNNKQNSYTDPVKYSTEFAQVRTGTKFTFPSVYGMTVKFKQADFEKPDGTGKREADKTYVTQSIVVSGKDTTVVSNPGLTTTGSGAIAVDGSGIATIANDNLDVGGIFNYAGTDTLATLITRECAMYVTPSAETSSKTVGALNKGTSFMHSLSVEYPLLYDLTVNVNMPADHVPILQNYDEMTEEEVKARAARRTFSAAKKNTGGRYKNGETVEFTVTPGYSFYFNASSSDVAVTGATTDFAVEKKLASGSFTITGAPVMTINLHQNTVYAYTTNVTPLSTGTLTISSGTGKDASTEYTMFPKDSTITITPSPKVGYQFSRWQNAEGTQYVTSDPGPGQALFPAGVSLNAETNVLTITVSADNAANSYVAVFQLAKEGTTYYDLPNAGLYVNETSYTPFGEILAPGDVTDNMYSNYKFPSQYTTSALYVPTAYTLYKPGYTLKNWVYIEGFDPEDPEEYYEDQSKVHEYQIGDYYYFDEVGEERHIMPIFRENQANFNYRTTTADITWDFRTAYFAQHLNFPTRTEFDYATHTTINGDVVIDVPLHINGIVDNTTLDEWCHFDEGTVITIPSGLGAKFTLATYNKLTNTTLDGIVPLEYTVRTENDIPVYYYTYTTLNTATSIDLVVGKDHTYYKSIRAQLPSADKVTLTTVSNNDAWGSIELLKANTTPELIANAEADSDVPYTTDGNVYTMSLGSYVKLKAVRERLYELKAFVIDGETISIETSEDRDAAAAKGYTVTVPTGTDKEYSLIFRLFSYATTVEAVYGDRLKHQITFSPGTQAAGEAPGVQVVEDGESFTMPTKNQTLYLEGYTLKSWMDEDGNTYNWGAVYTPDHDLYLSPVFEINEFTLFDIPAGGVTVLWPLATGDDPTYGGAPLLKYQRSSGVYVSQLKLSETRFIDVKLDIDCTASTAKVDNSASTVRCQVNTGSVIGVPTNSNTKITIYTVNGELSSTKIAGSTSEKAGSNATKYTPQLDAGSTRDYYATVAYSGNEATQNIEFAGDAGYFKMVKAEYGKVNSDGLPKLDYVTINNIALGSYGTPYETKTITELVDNHTITIPITLSPTALAMPKVKAEADQSDAQVTVNPATVSDPVATIIVKTATGSPVGVYKVVFAPSYTSVDQPALQKIEMNGMLVKARNVGGDLVDYLEPGTKMGVNGAITLTFNHDMSATDLAEGTNGLGQDMTANSATALTFRYWDLDVNTTYTFTIPASTLSDVYGNVFGDAISFSFTTSATSQVINHKNVNFVVTHRQTHSFNTADPTQNYTSTAKRQVASDELIANLAKAGIAYGTIDEGIAMAHAASSDSRYYIFVPDGEYQLKGNRATDAVSNANSAGAAPADNSGTLRPELVTKQIYNGITAITRENLSITGQSETGTKLWNKPEIEGISYTSTFMVNSGVTGFYVQDMTLTNAFDYKTSMLAQGANTAQAARAVVLRDRGAKTIMKNVTMDSWQDTYYSNLSNPNNDSRGYFENCTFKGYVDFFCGDGDHWFQNCTLMLRNGKAGNASNMMAPATSAVQKWGYVFKGCEIVTEDDATYTTCNGKFTLARPWKNSPAMSLINTKFNVLSSEDGYKQMSNSGLVLRMHEYNSVDGNGAYLDLSGRSLRASSPGAGSYSAVMTPAEAAEYTLHNALGGTDGYDPTLYTKQISMADAGLTTLDRSLTWDAQNEALCYFIFRKNASDGYDLYAITAENSYELNDEQIGKVFIVRAANQRGGLGEPSNELTYNVHESYQLELTNTQRAPIRVNDVEEYWSWSTIYLDYNAKAPTVADDNAEAQAYVYAVVDVTPTSMTLKRVNVLEKNQGYIVKGDVGTYTFAYTDSDGEYHDGTTSVAASVAASEGRLSILDGTVETIERGGMDVYTLYYKANYGLGFYSYTGNYLNHHKAYLNGSYVEEDGGGAIVIEGSSSGFIFLDDIEPTTIKNVNGNADTDDSEKIFTVYGQRVKRSEMIKGRVYIVNGRKVAY